MEPHESKTTSYCSESSYVSAGSSAIDSCKECVKVAVHIRPLIPSEKQQGCIECISVVPGLPQVQVGNHSFTFDHVYGNRGSPSSAIFQECVVPLVDGLFQGYNATVLAYGQTGSGKTYTMGTAYSLDENGEGVIPSVIDRIFKKVQELSAKAEILLKVSFIEILKEEVHDLLDPNSQVSTKSDGMGNGKAVQVKPPIQIRETPHGGITLTGVHEVDVRTQDEMASTLSQGSVNRATGSTNMNNQSSRSHAIFTIHMVNKRKWTADSGTPDDKCDDFVCAKLHLVDLAGSERAKRTGADGLRFKEGVHINKGLLALGNVISALGDEKKRKEGGHVPYRDSKLTRLLQDSLGGNSRTVMIACVSPADSNCEETLNTLKYANRARNIQNKAVINRDPLAAEMQRMRRQLEQVQAELLLTRAGGGISSEELQVLKHRISRLEEINAKLHEELQNCQVERDQLLLKLQKLRSGKSWEEIDNGEDTQNTDLIKGYVSRIRELENEIQQLQIAANLRRSRDNASRGFGQCIDMEHNGGETFAEISNLHDIAMECGEAEEEENLKEREYSAVQDKMGKELQELDSQLEQKEAEMKLLTKGDTTLLKHFEKKVMELEEEKAALQREMDRLKVELEKSMSHGPGETSPEVQQYTLRLKTLEAQITDLKRKQENQAQLLKQKQKSEESAKRLQEEILRIKQHRVQLQHKMKQESEQFRAWKASREKELLQLKKEGRRNEYEMHKLQALNQRQKLVLQRKTEEAAMATKKLKELLESRKANARDGHSNGGYQTNERYLLSNLEHEMEVVFHVDEVRARVEKQRQMRAAMASELERLKQDSLNGNRDASSTVVNSRIALLEALLMKTSSNIVDMASQLSEAEERERAFTGKSRWKEVRTMNDAKVVMNYLFNKATTARSEMRRKDLEIGEMTETIGELRSLLGRMEVEMQKQMSKLREQEARNRLSSIPVVSNQRNDFGAANNDNVPYDLRKPARTWYEQIAVLDGDEDMDISDGEDESDEDWRGEEDVVEEQDTAPRAAKKNKALKQTIKSQGEVPENNSKLEAPTCCGCGRGSGCKTTKCACRIAGQFCGPDCKCKVDKCTNREAGEFSAGSAFPQIKEEDGRAFTGTKVKLEDGTMNPDVAHKAETSKVKVECDESGNIDKDTIAEGAALLQNAFKDQFLGHNAKSDDNKQEETDDTKKRTRKPLSDIGNKNTKDDPKAKERRKWKKKATIQLVQTPATTEEPASATEEIAAASNLASNANVVPETTVTSTRPARPSEEIVQEPPLPIRLPRSMQRGAGTSPLRNRNFGVSEESGGDKSSNPPPSPSMILRGINGKENRKNR